jgi:hypothetical protein
MIGQIEGRTVASTGSALRDGSSQKVAYPTSLRPEPGIQRIAHGVPEDVSRQDES